MERNIGLHLVPSSAPKSEIRNRLNWIGNCRKHSLPNPFEELGVDTTFTKTWSAEAITEKAAKKANLDAVAGITQVAYLTEGNTAIPLKAANQATTLSIIDDISTMYCPRCLELAEKSKEAELKERAKASKAKKRDQERKLDRDIKQDKRDERLGV